MESEKKPAPQKERGELCVDPNIRLCSKFDELSIAKFPVAPEGAMGVRVVDNCAEAQEM